MWTSTVQFLLTNEASSSKMDYILLSRWLKGSFWKKTQAITKAIGCSPENDGKALLLKTTSKYVTNIKKQACDD